MQGHFLIALAPGVTSYAAEVKVKCAEAVGRRLNYEQTEAERQSETKEKCGD